MWKQYTLYGSIIPSGSSCVLPFPTHPISCLPSHPHLPPFLQAGGDRNWSRADELLLVTKVSRLGDVEESGIDWIALADGWSAVRSPQWLRNKWWAIKRTLPHYRVRVRQTRGRGICVSLRVRACACVGKNEYTYVYGIPFVLCITSLPLSLPPFSSPPPPLPPPRSYSPSSSPSSSFLSRRRYP